MLFLQKNKTDGDRGRTEQTPVTALPHGAGGQVAKGYQWGFPTFYSFDFRTIVMDWHVLNIE